MIKEPSIMKTESDAYEENASSLGSPNKTSATPAINAVTGKGKVSETQRQIINKNKAKTFLPGVSNSSANRYNSKLINDYEYTNNKILLLTSQSKSKIYIENYLLRKGVPRSTINEKLNIFDQENEEWELKSAYSFAQKKNLLK